MACGQSRLNGCYIDSFQQQHQHQGVAFSRPAFGARCKLAPRFPKKALAVDVRQNAATDTQEQQQRAPLECSQDVIDAEARLFVHTYDRVPVAFVRGHGCKLYDIDGKEYLDMAAGIAVNSLGHGDPLWVKAILEQATTLAHVSNVYHSLPQVRLAERLVQSSFADRVFFSNSGTEANEAAIKFARKYQRVKAKEKSDKQASSPLVEDPIPTDFVAFSNSFHGRTLGALALTSKEKYRAPFEPIMPGVKFVEFGNLEAAKKIVQQQRTAAVFVEPVQGEGGVYPAIGHFLEGLRALCSSTGTLLVFDEVQCGLGRTGKLWAHEAYGIEPDIMTLAKPLAGGLPIGAVLVTQAVADAIVPGDHGSTFAGSPLVCSAALAVLDRLQEPGFLDSVANKGNHLRDLLKRMLAPFPHVKEVRGAGLLVGIQLDVSAAPLVAAARSKGLIVLTAGAGDVVRLAPPLVISEAELEQCAEILVSCISSLD
ncbi:hypothetical protein SELMODRAFT_97066 [Selaginella moellendorffii]|uniref:Uncharacterized protein n=1 Tax=Selaginella moellendorffii TaxID=88036 RepID=D8RMD7_SELML|nr:acetylornithine aminotransferase, mitochondrial [Selaginella moellendorffii]EFJ26321.1 hypothetical protein SELMODRAFT_97066 [Selaginella moellendorffii]|eukprot:XP_002972235.1 acetylornithine aminotransferase, mitochondrial [Selaginella moellendorffii]